MSPRTNHSQRDPYEAEFPTAERTGGRPSRLDRQDWNPADWWTRGRVARELDVHISTVRRLEIKGDLRPHLGDGGIRYFIRYDVMDLKKRWAKKKWNRAAVMRLTAFDLFDQGVRWQDVAIRLRYDPLRIHHLWRLYSMDRRSDPSEQKP